MQVYVCLYACISVCVCLCARERESARVRIKFGKRMSCIWNTSNPENQWMAKETDRMGQFNVTE